MKSTRLFSWLPGLLAVAAVLLTLIPAGRVRGFDMEKFGRIPVLEGGRVKPLDSVARNSLLMIRSKQTIPFEGRSLSADEWLLDVLFRPQVADRQPLFVIDDPDVLGLLGMKQSSVRYFSFETLFPHLEEIQKQAQAAEGLEPKTRSRFQSAIVVLFERLLLYNRLQNSVQLADSPGLYAELQALRSPDAAARHKALADSAPFRPLPPLAGQSQDAWQFAG